jgi:thioredoxin-like negative regulator of GroEL
VRLLQDDWQEAHRCFVQALEQKNDHVEAALGLVESLIGMGAPEEALALVENVLGSDGCDAWVLAAFAARNLGRVQDCALFLEQVQRTMDAGFVAPHRRSYFHLLSADLGKLAG